MNFLSAYVVRYFAYGIRSHVSPVNDDLPAGVRAAWGIDAARTRGPRRALSVGAIAAAGIAVAERDGLQAVSMGRVAAELGASPMGLYRYVSGKDELLALMVDAAY